MTNERRRILVLFLVLIFAALVVNYLDPKSANSIAQEHGSVFVDAPDNTTTTTTTTTTRAPPSGVDALSRSAFAFLFNPQPPPPPPRTSAPSPPPTDSSSPPYSFPNTPILSSAPLSSADVDALYEQLKRTDPMCSGGERWWSALRAHPALGKDAPRAKCYKEVHAGEDMSKPETLVPDPARRYPCIANFDYPIVRPVYDETGLRRSVFNYMDVKRVLMMRSYTDGTTFCNLGYAIDNIFITLNFMAFPRTSNARQPGEEYEGCCVQIDAIEVSSTHFVPIDTHFHTDLWPNDRVVCYDWKPRMAQMDYVTVPVSNVPANWQTFDNTTNTTIPIPKSGAARIRDFWAQTARKKEAVPEFFGHGRALEINESALSEEAKAINKKRFYLFHNEEELRSIYTADNKYNADVEYLPTIGPDRIAFIVTIDLTSHPPLSIAMLLSSMTHFFTSGANLAHTNITVIVPDPAHSQKRAGHNFESLLRLLPVPVLYVQRHNQFPQNRLRTFYVPRVVFAPRGTIDIADECMLDGMANYIVPSLVARVRFALSNGRNASFPGERRSSSQTLRDPSEIPKQPRDYSYLYIDEYKQVGLKNGGGGYLLREPIPVQLERPWWPKDLKASTFQLTEHDIEAAAKPPQPPPPSPAPTTDGNSTGTAAPPAAPTAPPPPPPPRDPLLDELLRPPPSIDDLLRSPPENIVLMKTGANANSGARGVYPFSLSFQLVLRRLNYTILSDVLPIDLRMYFINHARRLITNWGGAATAVQGMFSGNVPAAFNTPNRWNNWTKREPDPKNRTLDVIMFMPPAYAGLKEYLWWYEVPLHHHHPGAHVRDPVTNTTRWVKHVDDIRKRVQNGIVVELAPPGLDTFAEFAFSSPHSFFKLVRANTLDDVREEHLVISDEEKEMNLGPTCRDRVVTPSETELDRRKRWKRMKYRFPVEEFF